MGLVIFRRYNNVGEALVAFSALESAGFHPSWHNYYHGHNVLMEVIALGGNIIQIPAQEYRDAHLYLIDIRSQPITEFDSLPDMQPKRFKHSLLFLTAQWMYLFPFSLFLLLPWKIALGLLSVFILWVGASLGFTHQSFLTFMALFGGGFAALAILATALRYPLRTTLFIILGEIAIGLWLGFNAGAYVGLLTLFLYLMLNLHAHFTAFPEKNRSNHEY